MYTTINPTLITGSWNFSTKNSASTSAPEWTLSKGLKGINQGKTPYSDQVAKSETDITTYKQNLASDSRYQIQCHAMAKPFGYIPLENSSTKLIPLYAEDPNNNGTRGNYSMVLPVFDKVSLVTYNLPDNNFDASKTYYDGFYYFLTEYMPLWCTGSYSFDQMESLMESNYPEDWPEMQQYHAALIKLDTASWRQTGIDWLKASTTLPDGSTGTNRDACNYPAATIPTDPPSGPGRFHWTGTSDPGFGGF